MSDEQRVRPSDEQQRLNDVEIRRLVNIGRWVESRIWDDASANEYRAAALAYADGEKADPGSMSPHKRE